MGDHDRYVVIADGSHNLSKVFAGKAESKGIHHDLSCK